MASLPFRAVLSAVAALAAAPASALEAATLAPFAGAPSATIEASDLEGRAFPIGSDPDRPVILHFFASWCEPCREEFPGLMAFMKGQGDAVRLIGVDVGEPASRARAFVRTLGFAAPVALDEDKNIAAAFLRRGLPATVVLAPGGGAALAAAGPLDWTSPAVGDAINRLKKQ
ncbi:TlpA family protein disulfide reductase [Hansschlegelia zhihuaiae]|uniref:TlpA family protein disulfide reductase n=1 Tax=Hansschlegelia zhihuaiae TaxID=405005 RepID=A0A4Q0MKE2_9HYPH|nr:TlpA disulfide reductase family protein [Hansschlegelia zhihuaiae]RXF73965.1 TlpA family protein disulfide reductase [Hansschlegelia zhihuaiae]